MADTTKLGLPLMSASQAQKHVTHNLAIKKLDILVQLTIIDRNLTAPPGSPSDGDTYIPASGATGAWDNKDLNVAVWTDGAWAFYAPTEGWCCWIQDENLFLVWDGDSWENIVEAAGGTTLAALNDGSLNLLGVGGAIADSTNRLAVSTPGVLFDAETDDIQVGINKAAAGNDAMFALQTGFSTRALVGLLANDDFTISVSPNGSTFYNALVVDKDTGNVAIGAGSDANNRLLVSGESMLFTNSGDLRFTFSKGASGDDVALTFQTNFSSRALIGLLANDDFTFSVSDDGSAYTQALIIDHATAAVSLEQHPKFHGYCNYNQYNAANTWFTHDVNNTVHNDQASVSSGVFTAPHDGYYMFGGGARLLSDGTPPTVWYLGFGIDGALPQDWHVTMMGEGTAALDVNSALTITACIKLTAGQTVALRSFFSAEDSSIDANFNFFWGAQIA